MNTLLANGVLARTLALLVLAFLMCAGLVFSHAGIARAATDASSASLTDGAGTFVGGDSSFTSAGDAAVQKGGDMLFAPASADTLK